MNCEGCKNKEECENRYFHIGDRITLRGRIFRIKSVKPSELRLKLVKGSVNDGSDKDLSEV